MANPNEAARLPRDGNGQSVQIAYKATTGTKTLATGTGTDDVTLPKGTLAISFWSTGPFGFLGIGASSGTEVTCMANVVFTFGCAGTDGTWKAFFDLNTTASGTLNYVLHMGATN